MPLLLWRLCPRVTYTPIRQLSLALHSSDRACALPVAASLQAVTAKTVHAADAVYNACLLSSCLLRAECSCQGLPATHCNSHSWRPLGGEGLIVCLCSAPGQSLQCIGRCTASATQHSTAHPTGCGVGNVAGHHIPISSTHPAFCICPPH
jgi:hypothetical protein